MNLKLKDIEELIIWRKILRIEIEGKIISLPTFSIPDAIFGKGDINEVLEPRKAALKDYYNRTVKEIYPIIIKTSACGLLIELEGGN